MGFSKNLVLHLAKKERMSKMLQKKNFEKEKKKKKA
jgi:hypothetical protein